MLRCRWVFSGEIAPSSGACAGAGGWGVVRGEMARMLGTDGAAPSVHSQRTLVLRILQQDKGGFAKNLDSEPEKICLVRSIDSAEKHLRKW